MRTPPPAGPFPETSAPPRPHASRTAGPAGISRRALLRGTAATGAALALAGAASVLTAAPALAAQGGWRWCNQCQGLWYGFNGPSNKPCPQNPAALGHNASGSGNYTLPQRGAGGPSTPDLADQWNWAWCRYCQGLWYTANSTAGVCPARGAQGHSSQGSSNYGLYTPVPGPLFPPGQDDWRWCHKCQGLWFSFNRTAGFCPAGGGHSRDGSADYAVPLN
jgi:hypothetical protein